MVNKPLLQKITMGRNSSAVIRYRVSADFSSFLVSPSIAAINILFLLIIMYEDELTSPQSFT